MIGRILAKIFGSKNDRMIKQYRRTVRVINELEATIEPLAVALDGDEGGLAAAQHDIELQRLGPVQHLPSDVLAVGSDRFRRKVGVRLPLA